MDSTRYNIMAFFVIVTMLMIALAVLIFFYMMFFARTVVPFTFMKGKLSEKYRIPLEKHFRYYQKLLPSEKIEFERRVNNFLHNKRFIPMHGLKEVTAEMKALISASAIQLTFGLPEVYFVHFNKILVFPSDYLNAITRGMHKGEVNENGVIAFSWKHFVEGYINSEDTYNLGLHEMAHALSLENGIPNQEYQFLDKQKLIRWKILADAEFDRIRSGETSFLRKYAASHREEFFPVCIEHFFERPGEFREEALPLYNALADLLNQNPLKVMQQQTA